MSDQDKSAKRADEPEAAPAPKGKLADDAQRDFLDYDSAKTVADSVGGTVEHVGVAFHVNDE